VKDQRPVYLGDDLFACQPIAEAILAAGGDFLLTAKPSSHKTLYDFMHGAILQEVTHTQKLAGKRLTYRYRWFEQAPLRDGKDAMLVNWIGVTITNVQGKATYENAFVTSLPVTAGRSPTWWPAPEPDGRSRTKASTCSNPTVIILSTTSAMANRTWL
jgi:hypothetical protein